MSSLVTTDSGGRKGREITGVYPQSLQDPKMGGSRLAKMADEEEELGTSGHEVEQLQILELGPINSNWR